jgi:hypothetical protein
VLFEATEKRTAESSRGGQVSKGSFAALCLFYKKDRISSFDPPAAEYSILVHLWWIHYSIFAFSSFFHRSDWSRAVGERAQICSLSSDIGHLFSET